MEGEEERWMWALGFYRFPPLAQGVSVALVTVISPGSISSYFVKMTYPRFSLLTPEGLALGERWLGSCTKSRSRRGGKGLTLKPAAAPAPRLRPLWWQPPGSNDNVDLDFRFPKKKKNQQSLESKLRFFGLQSWPLLTREAWTSHFKSRRRREPSYRHPGRAAR